MQRYQFKKADFFSFSLWLNVSKFNRSMGITAVQDDVDLRNLKYRQTVMSDLYLKS